jgi:hypothetical protein
MLGSLSETLNTLHWVLYDACFKSQCPTIRPSMSHMQTPFITIHKTSQSPSTTCCRWKFYMFYRRQKVSLSKSFLILLSTKNFHVLLQWEITCSTTSTNRKICQQGGKCKETPFKYFPKIGEWEFWKHCWFLQALHYKGSRFRVWACSFVLSLIVFNTNCLGTHLNWGFAHKEIVLH